MNYVLDSSVGFKTVVAEIDSDKALRLRDEFRAGTIELMSPDIYPTEMAHAIGKAERQKRITPAEGAMALTDTLRSLPDLHQSIPLLSRAYEIASDARIGVYDCIYVALAERQSVEMVTADDKLIRNLKPRFPFIIHLSTLP